MIFPSRTGPVLAPTGPFSKLPALVPKLAGPVSERWGPFSKRASVGSHGPGWAWSVFRLWSVSRRRSDSRKEGLRILAAIWASLALLTPLGTLGAPCGLRADAGAPRKPNILFLLADQWRAQAFGFAGDPNVRTPNIDRLAAEGIRLENVTSTCPVCCPYRASLLTGQRPLTHGVFMNDVPLPEACVTIAEVLASEGYDTGYIGKWHLDGRGRSSYTPPERRQGFRYWKALECTHEYNESDYFADAPERRRWEGYDAMAQTRDAQEYLRGRVRSERPFFLFLAWGPPHDPYHTAPARYRKMYEPAAMKLRPNVPAALEERVRRDLAGYYAHCTALDDCVGELRKTLKELGLEESTLLVFTSDHGDLVGSHGAYKKQQPYDEAVRVPLILHHPARFGKRGAKFDASVATEDLMPTILGFCGVKCPDGVEGLDLSGYLSGGPSPGDGAALLMCPQPFGEWHRQAGGREYRAVRTARYTYARDLSGPWLLFDNREDPHQLRNLVGAPEHASLQADLDALLERKLKLAGDRFLPGAAYLERWAYRVDLTGTVPYKN